MFYASKSSLFDGKRSVSTVSMDSQLNEKRFHHSLLVLIEGLFHKGTEHSCHLDIFQATLPPPHHSPVDRYFFITESRHNQFCEDLRRKVEKDKRCEEGST